jgi:hypothetical protein
LEDAPTPSAATRPSVIEPVSRALNWTGNVLFRPFDVGKWFTLGFCAWLAWLGQGGGGGGSSWNVGRDDVTREADRARDWVESNLELVIIMVVVLVFVGIAFGLLLTWLSSRGKFMFLDGVVHDRGAVTEPWRRFRELGNSLFGFRIVLGLVALVVLGGTVGFGILSLLAVGVREDDAGPLVLAFLVVWLALIVALVVALLLVAMVVNDFIVPIMWVRNCRVMTAWPEFLTLLSGNLGLFILYVLMKILLGFGIFFIACTATCMTCCITAVPYIGTVILLPLFVFRRAYSMFFLGQFGTDYGSLAPTPTTPAPAQEPA